MTQRETNKAHKINFTDAYKICTKKLYDNECDVNGNSVFFCLE